MEKILYNDALELRIDTQTGALTGLLNKKTGWQAIRQPKLAAGIKLLVPIENYRNNKVRSIDQTLSSYTELSSEKAVLKWDCVYGTKSGKLDIAVELVITLSGASATFDMTIDNHSPYVVEEAWAPNIGGMREPRGEEQLESITMHFQGGLSKSPYGTGFSKWTSGYWGVDCPTQMRFYPSPDLCAPFVLLTNQKQGIYLGSHDKNTNTTCFIHKMKPGYSDSMNNLAPQEDEIGGIPVGYFTGVARLPFVQPGEKVTLAPVVLAMFEGSWHHGADIYKKWRDTWFDPKPIPAWYNDIDCWMTLHINSSEDCCRYRYTELPEIMREAKENGVQALQLIGWARGGQDGAEPYQDIDPRLGTHEELKQAIKEIEEMGIRVLLMCKFKWADRTIPEYEAELKQHAQKGLYGTDNHFGGYSYQTILQSISGGSIRSGAVMCHCSADYRKLACREFEKILDLEPSGILYDELIHGASLCFDKSHGHRLGDGFFQGSLTLAEQFYDLATKRNPEFIFAGEGPIDTLSQIYRTSYIRSWDPWYRAGWRYIDEQMKIATCLIGFDDREMVNQCIAYSYIINYEPYNFKGRVSDFPLTVAYGQKAQALRRRLWDYIWNGTYTDSLGATVTPASEGSNFVHTVYTNKENGKKAVVVVNYDNQKELAATVALDSDAAAFDQYTIEDDAVIPTNGSITIPPRSLVVLVEK